MPLFRRAIPLLLAAALAASARAGVVGAVRPVFSPPAGAWAGPLGAAFADPALSSLLPPGLGGLNLTSPEALRVTAPLVQSLTKSLSVTPQAFAALPAEERKAVVELAGEDARETVRARAYELATAAQSLGRSGRTMDKDSRAELYATVAKLMEIREFYGGWLDDSTKAAVEDGYAVSSLKAWEVRNFLLDRDAEPAPVRAREEKPAARTQPLYRLSPSGAAVKLRADMENNKSGWGQNDLDALYTGYGFVLRQGGKHRMYYHPAFPQLTQSVSRQNDLPPGYAQSAVKLIRELEQLVENQGRGEAAPETGPPATIDLNDLAVLLSTPREKPAKTKTAPPERKPSRVATAAPPKTAPAPPAPPRVTARLAPAEPVAREAKPEPPAVEIPAKKPAGVIERIKIAWDKLKTRAN